MDRYKKKVAIIGGGISGLTSAFWLKANGIDINLFEKSNRVGGTIRTEFEDGFLIEHGPNSTLETTPFINKLLYELDLINEKIFASKESNKRYILRNGKIFPLPMGPIAFLGTKLFSPSAKLRLLKEPFIRSKGDKYESIAEFTQRRLGQEFLDYAINPFVAGVFAGDPNLINVKTAFPKLYDLEQNYGSLIKGAIKSARQRKKSKEKSKQSAKTISFKKGMQTLVDAIHNRIKDVIFLNSTIENIQLFRDNGNVKYKIEIKNYDGVKSDVFDSVLICSPAYSISRFTESLDKDFTEKLKNIYYPPVNVIYTGFKKLKISYNLDGFGYLIPEKENRKILGSLWNSVLFPGRAPDDCHALTSFIGGARSPELTKMDDSDLVDITVKELDTVLGIKGKPDFVRIIRWEKAIPQYNNHYTDIFDSVEDFQNKNKGLFICNNFYCGIGVGDCIKNADATVTKVLNYLKD